MKRKLRNLFFLFFVLFIVSLSIWGPEVFSQYTDQNLLGVVCQQQAEISGDGYQYILSSNEKLFILSRALASQVLPESEQSAKNRAEAEGEDYLDRIGPYAFIVNHRGPTGEEISGQELYETCNQGLAQLKEAGILPEEVLDVEPELYDALLYSAIDAREPRNNVAVWKLTLSTSLRNVNKENHLIDACIDADNGKIYEFYARVEHTWEEIDPDQIMLAWSRYLGLPEPEAYEGANPLMEITPYFKKYVFSVAGGERTIVTIGFYEGIRELFISASPGR